MQNPSTPKARHVFPGLPHELLYRSCPGDPPGPGFPGGPELPRGPDGPEPPDGPGGPLGPAGPGNPCAPGLPAGPGFPAVPAGPTPPGGPLAPCLPGEPSSPDMSCRYTHPILYSAYFRWLKYTDRWRRLSLSQTQHPPIGPGTTRRSGRSGRSTSARRPGTTR